MGRIKYTLLMMGCALLMLLAACGDEDRVKACIREGGHPFYTQDAYGNVQEFLGCHKFVETP